MFEAVNSVLSNAPLLRGPADQQSSARSLAANPKQVQVVSQAPYVSQYISVDIDYDTAVILIRDSETGDTVRQIPTEPALEAARRQMAAQAAGDQFNVSDRVAPTPAEAKQASYAPPAQTARQDVQVSAPAPQAEPQAPAIAAAAFGAFTKQVASLQTAIAGGSTGNTVSLSA
jgi:hypothetical protein